MSSRKTPGFTPPPIPARILKDPVQKALVEALVFSSKHTASFATAGSGKSSTMRAATLCIDPAQQIVIFAYNKKITLEHLEKFGPGLRKTVQIITTHAHGLRTLTEYARDVQGKSKRDDLPRIDDQKYTGICLDYLRACGKAGPSLRNDAEQLAEFVLHSMDVLAPATHEALRDVCKRFNLTPPADLDLPHALKEISQRGLEIFLETGRIDFTEMLWLPLKLKLGQHPLRRSSSLIDHAFVDETQDCTRLILEYIHHMTVPTGGRIAMWGDPEQCIYMFTGADRSGMLMIAERIAAERFDLRFSYRCPAAVVAKAKEYSRAILAAPDAAEGLVLEADEEQVPDMVSPGDLIVALHNVDATAMAMRLMKLGQKVTMLNDKLEKSLKTLAANALGGKDFTPQDVAFHLNAYADKELERLWTRGLQGEPFTRAAEKLKEGLGCLASIAVRAAQIHGTANTGDLNTLLDTLFNEEFGVRIGSVHSSKGLEAPTVVVLNPDALNAEEGDEADARRFVAATRSEGVLVYAYKNNAARVEALQNLNLN